MRFILLLYILCQLIQVGLSAMCMRRLGNGAFRHEWYDPQYKICCGGILAQRTSSIACCNNSELYSLTTQICCNGKITERKVSRSTKKWEPKCAEGNSDCVDMMCCGKELIAKEDNALCCDGTSVNLTAEQVQNKDFLECCGKTVFNAITHLCCDDVFERQRNVGCCNGDIFNKNKYVCIGGEKMERTEGICDGEHYNKSTDTCCEGRLINVPEIKHTNDDYQPNPEAKCCGKSIIRGNEVCCEERLYGYPTHAIPKDHDLQCCGKEYYNTTAQFCVSGEPKDREPYLTQCGNILINSRVESCCANRLAYNHTTQKCCEGAHYCVVNAGDKCCNGQPMKENELCCDNIKPCKKENDQDNECCYDYEYDNGRTYDDRAMTCHRGRLYHLKSNEWPCGRNDVYNTATQFCCGDRKYEHNSGQCCGGVFYNIPKLNGSCCIIDNRAYRFEDYTNPCIKQCGNEEYYDVSTQLCCEGKTYKETGRNYCCGDRAIDSSRMECCGGQFPYRSKKGRKGCCGRTQVYDRKYFTCSADGKLESKERLSDVEKVCHPRYVKMFEGAIQQACERTYVISGRVTNVADERGHVRISLRNVRSLKEGVNVPRLMTFRIDIGQHPCQRLHHLQRLKRVLVFFDAGIRGKNVAVLKDSHFFINRQTLRRNYSIRKAISNGLCAKFSL